MPRSAAGRNECEVVARCARLDELGEAISSPVHISIVPVAISLFEFRPVRADGVPVSPAFYLPLITDGGNWLIGPGDVVTPGLRPASAGEVVVLWGTGGGLTLPLVAEAENAPADGSCMAGPLFVSIGGSEARVLYAGLAPGYAGLYQFNVEVPAGVPRGKVEVQIGQPSFVRSYDFWVQ